MDFFTIVPQSGQIFSVWLEERAKWQDRYFSRDGILSSLRERVILSLKSLMVRIMLSRWVAYNANSLFISSSKSFSMLYSCSFCDISSSFTLKFSTMSMAVFIFSVSKFT